MSEPASQISRRGLPPQATTILLAIGGAIIFSLANLPLPLLLGPIFGCLIGALLGLPLKGAGQISVGMRTIVGVAVGASVTPALFARLPEMAMSVSLIPFFILVIGLIGYPWFRKFCGFDHATSYYSAMPGGLQDMLVFGEEAGGDPRALSLIHATRVMVIVSAAPFLLQYLWGLSLDHPPGEPVSAVPWQDLAILGFCCLAGWKAAEAVGLFGASILGPLIFAAIASLLGLIHHRPPAEAIWAAQFFIGMGVGAKYSGITMKEVRHTVLSGLGYCLLLALISALFVAIIRYFGLANSLEAFLAFAPGGQAEMAVLSIVAGADLAFVITHHLLRILLVILGAPIIGHLLVKQKTSSE